MLVGNPNLTPETSHGFNLSGDYSVSGELTLSAGAFFNYIFDLIDDYITDENPGSAPNASGEMQNFIYTRSYRNVGEAITAGGDVSLRYNGSRFKTALTYNYTLAKELEEDTDTWTDLASRVPHQVNAAVSYRIPVIETTAQVQANWNAPQLISSGQMGGSSSTDKTWTPDYLMVNLRITKTFFGEKLEVYGGVQNALNNIHFVKSTENQTQEEYYGLRDGIIFSIGASFKW